MSNRPVEDELQELRDEFQDQRCDVSEQDKKPTKNKFVEKPLPSGDSLAMIGGIIEAVGDAIVNILGG